VHFDFRRRSAGTEFGWNTFIIHTAQGAFILSISATMDHVTIPLSSYHSYQTALKRSVGRKTVARHAIICSVELASGRIQKLRSWFRVHTRAHTHGKMQSLSRLVH
jgi:hypothetical protein